MVESFKKASFFAIALAVFLSGAARSHAVVNRVEDLNIAPGGTLDLGDTDLIVGNGTLYQNVFNDVRMGLNSTGQLWTGTGITSSVAASQALSNPITGLGLILNDSMQIGTAGSVGGDAIYTSFPDPVTPVPLDSNDILVRYTYFGDADIDGVISATDYFLINNAFNLGLMGGGWINGDFDYSGAIDGTDFFLINNAFANQGGPLTASAFTISSVPEPSTLALGLLGIAVAAWTARHHRRHTVAG